VPDDVLDVDAAVTQRGAFLVGLGDLGLEGDDALQAVVDLGHDDSSCWLSDAPRTRSSCRMGRFAG
jgi:hypothetical protein